MPRIIAMWCCCKVFSMKLTQPVKQSVAPVYPNKAIDVLADTLKGETEMIQGPSGSGHAAAAKSPNYSGISR